MRPVGRDSLVCFEGRQYSVPFRLIGETVEVRGVAGAVQVLKACAEAARHPRGTAGGWGLIRATTTDRARSG